MSNTITWDQAGRTGRTAAGHRVRILHKQDTTLRVVQVYPPVGGRVEEIVSTAEDDATSQAVAQQLVDDHA